MSILDDTRMMIKVCKMYYQEGLSQNEMEELAQRAIDCATSEEVQDLVNQYAK